MQDGWRSTAKFYEKGLDEIRQALGRERREGETLADTVRRMKAELDRLRMSH